MYLIYCGAATRRYDDNNNIRSVQTYVLGDFPVSVRVGQGVLKLVFDGYSVERHAAVVHLRDTRKEIKI
jgi:hypothetical protein